LEPCCAVRAPHADFLTFYATARRTVSPERFAPVDGLYRDALSRTIEWIEQSGVDDLTEKATRSAMAAIIDEQVTFDEVTTAMAAAQVAFFRSGWFLKIDPRELRSGLLRFPSARIDAATWRRLRAYRDPARAATTALYLSGARPQDIRELTMADLTAWHRDRDRAVAGVAVPEEAEPYLLAQTLSRATFRPESDGSRIRRERPAGAARPAPRPDRPRTRSGRRPLADDTTHGSRRVNTRVFGLERIS
jgi:hypothetical protein